MEEVLRPRVAAVAEQPLSGAVLACMMVAFFLLPGLPPILTEVMVVLTLVSWARLMPVVVSPALRPVLYALMGAPRIVASGPEQPERPEKFGFVAFDSDASRIVAVSGEEARLWFPDMRSPVATMQQGEGPLVQAAFSPNGRHLVTASQMGMAWLWDVGDERITKAHDLKGHDKAILYAGFSPDSRLVVTASSDRTARLWTLDGEQLGVLDGHAGQVNHATVSR
ncbi:MAG: hypothetical protein GY778_21110, partial [bacterium]|nr:hypothetical protein [bacterium]